MHQPSPATRWAHALLVLAGLLLLLPAPAYADAGTPLLLTTLFQLIVGNALIGVGEGWLLARVFTADRKRAIKWMIPANYVSMVVGFLSLDLLQGVVQFWLSLDPPNIHTLPALLVGTVVASYLVTILLEWPFCWWVLRPTGWPRTLLASVTLQSASYALLVPVFFFVSDLSLYSTLTVDQAVVTAARKDALVYYLCEDQQAVCRIGLNGSRQERVLQLGPRDPVQRLFPRPATDGTRWDLWVVEYPHQAASGRRLLEGFAERAAIPGVLAAKRVDSFDTVDLWPVFNVVADELRDEGERGWSVRLESSWAYHGFRADGESGQSIVFGVETLLAGMWRARFATALPGNQVVFQLGTQIVLVDLPSRRIGFITHGWSPVVGLGPLSGRPAKQ